jgi:hypothetical protein
MRAYALALTIAIFLFVPGISKAQDTLKVLNPVVITIDDTTRSGQTILNLKNDSPDKNEKRVILSVNVPGPKGSSAKFFFADNKDQTTGSSQLDTKIKGGDEKDVWLSAVDVSDLGEFDVDLINGTTLLTKIRLKRGPFNIKFDGPTPDKADVALVDKESFPIRLKNEDARPYPLTWRLLFNGVDVCRGNVTLPPAGVGLLNCSPTVGFEFSRVKDLFKPDSSDKNLLELYPGQDVGNGLPVKTLAVSGSMSYYKPFTQQFWGYVAIVGILILGGLTSLVLSQALPNRLQRAKLEEQLEGLAVSTADLSSHVESKLQVLLRLERSQISDLLDSRKSWSPDFQGVVTLCTQALGRLTKRVGLAQQMDVVLRRLANMSPNEVAPKQVGAVGDQLQEAAVLIGKTASTDAEMEAAQAAITKASDLVNRLNETDHAFGQDLAQRALKLKADIEAHFRTNATFNRVIAAVPGPDVTLQRVPNTAVEIDPDFYVDVDVAIEKMSLIRDYVILHDTRANDARTRLEAAEERFISLLQTDNPHDLREARLLFHEMKDDVYADRIGELLNNDNATIEINPRVAYHAAPMELCVHFQNQSVNPAAARDEWTCTWDFGDGLEETGWTVSHYFLVPKPTGARGLFTRLLRRPYSDTFPVVATFERTTERTDDSPAGPFILNRNVEVRSRVDSGVLRGRTWTEGLRLAAALLIAVFGLVAGARDQLTKLDILPGLVAVFLVGFGADTIKNLLAPKS